MFSESLILMHFISCPPAPPQIEAFGHQLLHLLNRGCACFRVMALFCGYKPCHRFAMTSDKDVMSFLCFAKKTRELLVGLTCSYSTHSARSDKCHYNSAFQAGATGEG